MNRIVQVTIQHESTVLVLMSYKDDVNRSRGVLHSTIRTEVLC